MILYGARGDERPDSDWDILVLTDYSVDLITERRFRNKLYDLELEIGEPFSIFVYSKNDWQTKQRITPFYAVNALLVLNGIQTKSHSATKSQFSLHFVKTEKFEKNMDSFYQSCLTGDKREIMKISLITIMI